MPAALRLDPVLLLWRRNQALKPVTITCCESFRQLPRLSRRTPVNPNNLTIAPKLGIVVGVAQLGLCVAVALAAYLLQREMPNPAILGGAILGIATSSGIIAWVIGRSVSRALGQLAARMRALADGELQADIPGIGRTDELGALAATVLMLNDHALRIRGTENAEVDAQQRAVAECLTAIQTLA